ncbi:MAG: hypothetical protein R3F62_12755 [Planctomycetota bacterium]
MIRSLLTCTLLASCAGCTLPALDPRAAELTESPPAGRDWALVAAGPFRTQEKTSLVSAVRGDPQADPAPPANGFTDGALLSSGSALETTAFYGFQVAPSERGSIDPGVQPPRVVASHAFRPLEQTP